MRSALLNGYHKLIIWGRGTQAQVHNSSDKDTMEQGETPKDTHIFFRLPPEIRHHIYRLLLAPKDEKRWIHAAILECSRRFNEDATPILYRENIFKLEWFTDTNSLLQVWAPESEKFSLVSRMNIPRNTPSQAVIDLLPRFPALWEVEIQLGAGSNQGSQFLDMVRARLDRIKKVILVLWITRNETKHAYDLTKATAENVLREECRCGYGDVLDVPDGYLGREMQLEYQAPKANYQRFGAPGILRLTLEKL